MERLIVKQWEAFYEFFAGCDFFMVLFILLIPAVLLGLSEKIIKWYRWLLSLFLSGRYTAQQNTAALSDRLCYFAAYLVKIYLYLRKNTEEISISMATLFSEPAALIGV